MHPFHAPGPQGEAFLGEHDDRASLRRLVGERGELRPFGEIARKHVRRREELGGLAVAERDRPGLVEKQHVDVARGLDGAARTSRGRCAGGRGPSRRSRSRRAGRRSSSGSGRRGARSGPASSRRPSRRARRAAASRWRSGRRSSVPRAGSRARSRWASSGARRLRRERSSGRGRSRPGFDVISTTMRSERTRVPPVTAERSPPDSRMTGADSPVIADSSTDAIPSTTVPSPGIIWPASTTTRSPLRRLVAGTASSPLRVRRRAIVSVRPRRRAAACALPRPFGHRLGEVREEEGEPEPERDLKVEEDVLAAGDVAHEEDA